MTTSEMVTADTGLWHSRKSSLRLVFDDSDLAEPFDRNLNCDLDGALDCNNGANAPRSPRIIQIAGSEPEAMAEAARASVDNGAQIVDINMGCPAKKVCNKAAGSALLKDQALVEKILREVVNAVRVPVTLKIRTGWCTETRNGETIARIAEHEGIAALTVHGRTRACRYDRAAEYDTIRRIVRSVSIPVIANGDIDSAMKARQVLSHTGAQAVMIGRAAQGRPWIFREVDTYLKTGLQLPEPSQDQVRDTVCEHLRGLYQHYGEHLGVRVARKHVKWYCANLINRMQPKLNDSTGTDTELTYSVRIQLQKINKIENSNQQYQVVRDLLTYLINREDIAA